MYLKAEYSLLFFQEWKSVVDRLKMARILEYLLRRSCWVVQLRQMVWYTISRCSNMYCLTDSVKRHFFLHAYLLPWASDMHWCHIIWAAMETASAWAFILQPADPEVGSVSGILNDDCIVHCTSMPVLSTIHMSFVFKMTLWLVEQLLLLYLQIFLLEM